MPIYEFQCDKCGTVQEMLVSFAEAVNGKLRCDDCGGKLKRVFSVTADSRGSSSESSSTDGPACGYQGG